MKKIIISFFSLIHLTIFADSESEISKKLDSIQIPNASFFASPLPEVLIELQRISTKSDTSESNPSKKGVQFIYKASGNENPPNITITLAQTNLRNAIKIICEMVSWHYHISENGVILSKFPESSDINPLQNEFFEVTQATINRMIGSREQNADPFAAPNPNTKNAGVKLKEFLEANGVVFDSAEGHRFVFDGFQIVVTHDSKNIKKIATILRRNDHDILAHIAISAQLFEAPAGTLTNAGRALKLSKQDTANFPMIPSDVVESLTNVILENGAQKIHSPNILVLDGKAAMINSGEEYHFDPEGKTPSPANSKDLSFIDKKSDSRQLGLTLKVVPEIQKYQTIALDLSSHFTRLLKEEALPNGKKKPIFWTSSNETSIILNPGHSFMHITSSSKENFELITVLKASIKR